MRGYIPLPQFRAPGPLNFSGLNAGIDAVGEKLEQNRLLEQNKAIGSAIQADGYGGGADAAFAQGNLSVGGQLAGLESADEDRDFNRNRLLAQDARSAASDARSKELHGLKLQEAKSGIRDRLVKNVAGIAQMIRSEADPSRKAQMVQALISSNPRMGQELSNLGFDPANPDGAMDMILAEARGLPVAGKDQFAFTKYGVGNKRTGELQPYPGGASAATTTKPPSGYRYSQDGSSLEAIPGGPATKLPGDMAGRMAALQTAKESFGQVREFYKGQGTMDRVNQLANRGKAGQVERNVSLAIEVALRAMTGAAAPDSEVKNYLNIFGPSALDTPATIEDKLDRLQSFLTNVEANITQGRSTGGEPTQPPAQQSPTPATRLRYNPATGELE
jgi:hypothetical protein